MPRRSSLTPSPRRAVVAREPQVTVRCARTSDAGSVAPLFDAYRQFYGAASNVAGARRFLLERLARGQSVVFIAVASHGGAVSGEPSAGGASEVVGFAQLYPTFSSVALRPVIVLNDLFVVPAWRRARVARRLIHDVVGYAARVGAARIELSTQHANAAAIALYGSIGFVADREFDHMSLGLRRS